MYNKMTEAARTKQANEERQRKYQKQKLIENMGKKMKTTMIGSIAAFEKNFGYLWGLGLLPNELSIAQKENKMRWEETRNEILNRGNANLRSMEEELSLYTVKKEGYRIDLIINKGETNGNNV